MSVDPVTASAINGTNFNRYWYGNNNPYKFTDPDGRLAGCQDCVDYATAAGGAAVFAGGQMADAGSERGRYAVAAGNLGQNDSAGRSALKAESRANTPSMVRAAVAAARPSTAATEGSGGRANVANPSVNAAGSAMKVGGRTLVVLGAAQQVNEIANSSDPARDVAGAGGMTLGAIGGGEGGAWAGAAVGAFFGGPPGAAVGAVVGGLTGSAGGAVVGEKAAEKLYDKTRE